jgi:chromate reductase
MPLLLGISGSLRRHSFNTAILESLADALGDKATLRIFPLNAIPMYDQDTDTETPPETVAAFRAAIGEADGIVIASPEYNHGMPGVLKNALDWASRPYGKATLTGKPVFTLTSSPGAVGGARAQAQLNETLASIGARTLLRPQSVIGAVHEKMTDGRLGDQGTLDFLMHGVDDLLREIARPASAVREAN